MSKNVKLLKTINKLFPLPVHPFNEGDYGLWQFEKGAMTLQNYAQFESVANMLSGKQVLDVGCGAGGKSLYYASMGAEKVTGIDIIEKYKIQADNLAQRLQIKNVAFHIRDACETGFTDESFDTIIMNDSMEHIQFPAKVLLEMKRILKPHGKLYINFPPYNHPYGAHLSDVIGIPWVHLFFSDNTLIQVYKELVAKLPDGPDRVNLRISPGRDGKEYFSYINHMTIQRFNQIISALDLSLLYYKEIPLRSCCKFLCHGFMREYFVKTVVAILEK